MLQVWADMIDEISDETSNNTLAFVQSLTSRPNSSLARRGG